MVGTSKGARKRAAKLLKKDPNFYSRISLMAKKPRGGKHTPSAFKLGDPRTKKLGSIGGRKSRRGPAKLSVRGRRSISMNELHRRTGSVLSNIPPEFTKERMPRTKKNLK